MGAAPLGDRDRADGTDDGNGGGDTRGREAERRSLPAATGLIGVLAALVLVLWVLSLTSDGGDGVEGRDAVPVDEDLFIAPTTTTTLREAEASTDVASEGEDPRATAPAEPFSDLEGRLIYLSGHDVAIVDLATGALERLRIEATESPLQIAGLEFLNDGRRTVGLLLADDPPTAWLVASRALVIPAADPMVDYWVVTRPDGPRGLVYMAGWQSYSELGGHLLWVAEAPVGSELVTGGESDVLVVPPVGSTYRPTISGFEIASDHRALAASGGLRVEQRCDEELACTIVALDGDSREAHELPRRFVDELHEISVSPNGRWLLNDTSPARLFDRHTGELSLLDVGGYGGPQWSEDSTSVAWLTSDRTPTLVVARLEPPEGSRDWFAVELAGLGADPTPGSSFLLDATLSPQ